MELLTTMYKPLLIIFCAVLTALMTLTDTANAQSVSQSATTQRWTYTMSANDMHDVVMYADYNDFDIVFDNDGPFAYTGNPIKLNVKKITYNNGTEDIEIPSDNYRVEEGAPGADDTLYVTNNGGGEAQFLLSYSHNDAIGPATLTVTGDPDAIGNYNFSKTFIFTIEQACYAKISDNDDIISEGVTGKTLTFMYSGAIPAEAYDLNTPYTETGNPNWYSEHENITKVVFDDSFQDARPTSCMGWFRDMINLSEIVGLSNLNTSEVTIMGSMFTGCAKLNVLDISNFNTGLVTKANGMFEGCTNLTTIIVGTGWSTTKITNSLYMFHLCTALIGNDGTTYDETSLDKTKAHADAGGYLTKGNYKIFFDGDASGATMDNCETCTTNDNDYIYTEYSDDFTLPVMKRAPYTFKGWKRILDYNGNMENKITETVSKNAGNRWFKAQWDKSPKYSVVTPEGFTATPPEDHAGENITITYSGSKPVGSIKLVPLPTFVKISPSNLNLSKDVTQTLTADIFPDLPEVNKAVRWTSNKPEVVSVTETSELQTTITTHAFGKALIKATTEKNNKSDSVWVICSAESPIYYVDPMSGDDDNDGVSESTAFKTFDAVFCYITDAEKDYIINFKGECTDAVIFESYTAKSLTIRGSGSGTDYLKSTVTTSDNSIIFENIKIKQLSGGAVLKDGAVTENVTTASNLTVSGSAKAGNVTLQGDAKIIIAGELSSDTVATITPSNYSNQVVELADGVTETKIAWERDRFIVTPKGSDFYYVQDNGKLGPCIYIDEENDAAHPYILKIDDRRTSGNYSPEVYAAENITDATTDKSFYITFDNWKRISDKWSACVNFFNYNAGTTFTYYITIEGTNSSTASEYAGINIGLATEKTTTGNIKFIFGTTTTGTFTFKDGKADSYQHPDFEVRGEMTGTLTFEVAPGCTFSGTVGSTTYTDITEFFTAAQNHKGGSTMTITKN